MPLSPSLDALLVYVEASEFSWTLHRRQTLGLYYLAQHAADGGFSVKVDILSANDNVVHRLARLLKKYRCRVLGFYVDHDNQWEVRRVVAGVKAALPDCAVILGGPQPTAVPHEVLERIPQAECAVVGEGEETFVEFLRLPVRDRRALLACRGLAVPGESGVTLTEARLPVEPLDRLSIPRREEFRFERDGEGMYGILTGRGCTGRCTFCYEGGHGPSRPRRLRLHSVAHMLAEVEYLLRTFRPPYIAFLDDTFVADARRLREFCRALVARYRGEVKWFCEARVDSLWRAQDLLPLMIEAGLVRMQVGGESGCQHILDAYRKGITLEQLRGVAQAAHQHGLISMYVNFIVGGAFETRDSARQTREFACELMRLAPGCVAVGHSLFTPYPATPIYDHPQDYGLQIIDKDVVTGFGDSHVFCRSTELSRHEILELAGKFESQTRQTMQELSQTLPWERVEHLFEAQHKWGLESEWYEYAAQDAPVALYHRARFQGLCRRFAEVWQDGLDRQMPLRMLELKSSTGQMWVVRTANHAVLQLDPVDSMLVELSVGKLTFAEILAVVADRLPGVSVELLRADILDRFHRLDDERVILWKNIAERRAPGRRAALAWPKG